MYTVKGFIRLALAAALLLLPACSTAQEAAPDATAAPVEATEVPLLPRQLVRKQVLPLRASRRQLLNLPHRLSRMHLKNPLKGSRQQRWKLQLQC